MKFDPAALRRHQDALCSMDARGIVRWALGEFGPEGMALASSFSHEDQVLTAMLAAEEKSARIFTLDTGRLFQETYDVMQVSAEKYGLHYLAYAPEATELAALVGEHGPNLFRQSVELRKACCEVRKVRPLKKALHGLSAWMCGLRRGQSQNREDLEAIVWDEANGLYKISPLINWTEEETWRYVVEHRIPYNVLHHQGFRSIGCAPCTRAVSPGDDVRSGRWWWESPDHKECGLHRKAG